MKRFTLVVIAVILVFILSACSSQKCDNCGKDFTGDAYYDAFNPEKTLCKDCAIAYYAPFPYKNYKK